jgi:hypothetical protein
MKSNTNFSQWLWWVERDSILLAYYSSTTDTFTSPTEADKKVTLFYIQRPDKFLLENEAPERDGFSGTDVYLGVDLAAGVMTEAGFWDQECEIPEQFHEALVARVIGNGFERRAETLQLATYFLNKYNAGVKEAKKYSYRGRDGSIITPQPQAF